MESSRQIVKTGGQFSPPNRWSNLSRKSKSTPNTPDLQARDPEHQVTELLPLLGKWTQDSLSLYRPHSGL